MLCWRCTPHHILVNLVKMKVQAFLLNKEKNFNSLLEEFEKCFERGEELTPFIEHKIDTGNHLPVAVTPYRLSPARQEILKKEIDVLLAAGVIEECDSPYATPVVLVPKPNSEFRLCVDYRKLNAVTRPDPYPLPRMNDLFQNAKQTANIATIDLKSGYHQVPLYPPTKTKLHLCANLESTDFQECLLD
ncbi:Transposon Ty3-I Gag-Pol polyprotein [Araneus ventricosus]|uniref:Transposon Ty3-I Gag-Pol polyprotein n=1 Tax=Araneus ventricosus TaxID=182803 RepID=A0A4Y2P446_ARAVE|nr:Transposon Ty3-I Gag-Pol polyprotein [Araneus ventricosus]